MSYWDWPKPERNMRERALEDRLIADWYDRPHVLSVRRQYKCAGKSRADLVVLQGHGDFRHITVVEIKASTAGLSAFEQLVFYMDWIGERCDKSTPVHGVIAAPGFQRKLVDHIASYDPWFVRLEQVQV